MLQPSAQIREESTLPISSQSIFPLALPENRALCPCTKPLHGSISPSNSGHPDTLEVCASSYQRQRGILPGTYLVRRSILRMSEDLLQVTTNGSAAAPPKICWQIKLILLRHAAGSLNPRRGRSFRPFSSCHRFKLRQMVAPTMPALLSLFVGRQTNANYSS